MQSRSYCAGKTEWVGEGLSTFTVLTEVLTSEPTVACDVRPTAEDLPTLHTLTGLLPSEFL